MFNCSVGNSYRGVGAPRAPDPAPARPRTPVRSGKREPADDGVDSYVRDRPGPGARAEPQPTAHRPRVKLKD